MASAEDPGTLRLFVAIRPPEEVLRAVTRRCRELSQELAPARWVEPQQLHLTLLFLGEVASEARGEIEDRLARGLSSAARFDLGLVGGGTFPPSRPARVAWIGVDEPAPVVALHRQVVRYLGRQGSGPFTPHLTVARPRRPWPRSAVARFEAAVRGSIGPRWTVEEVALVRSRLEPTGARHDTLRRYSLG